MGPNGSHTRVHLGQTNVFDEASIVFIGNDHKLETQYSFSTHSNGCFGRLSQRLQTAFDDRHRVEVGLNAGAHELVDLIAVLANLGLHHTPPTASFDSNALLFVQRQLEVVAGKVELTADFFHELRHDDQSRVIVVPRHFEQRLVARLGRQLTRKAGRVLVVLEDQKQRIAVA